MLLADYGLSSTYPSTAEWKNLFSLQFNGTVSRHLAKFYLQVSWMGEFLRSSRVRKCDAVQADPEDCTQFIITGDCLVDYWRLPASQSLSYHSEIQVIKQERKKQTKVRIIVTLTADVTHYVMFEDWGK